MPTTRPLRSASLWSQVLAVLLVGVMGMQGVPLSLLQHAAPTPCVCMERGYCPRNPDGPCTCEHGPDESETAGTHHHSENTHEGPVLQPCAPSGSDALTAVSPLKWLIERPPLLLSAPTSPSPSVAYRFESPQGVGEDVVYPPWAA